ncbi:hypothetical protein [Kutzneria sp. 744]|uniref:hypothetical protein n=1 Tax=Kutzneria sp. (strain 744) TaxID=345341 RepID=UPI0003EEC655|nr:hypothetical protein [Kutzneria sp. 744]EWM19776.1 hypothetical protein KUTG_10080 [Kutzneria sp. 744]
MNPVDGDQPDHPAGGYVGFDNDHEPALGEMVSRVGPLVLRVTTPFVRAAHLALGAFASLVAAAALVPLLRHRHGVTPTFTARTTRPGLHDRSDQP